MIELYTVKNLSIGETALRLQTNYKTVPDELSRHGIENTRAAISTGDSRNYTG